MKKIVPAGGLPARVAPADPPVDRAAGPIADLPASLRVFTVREAAGILKVTSSVVRSLIHEGKLRGSRVGVQIRIPATALEAFLGEALCRGPDPRRDPRRGGKAAGGPERAAARPPPWS